MARSRDAEDVWNTLERGQVAPLYCLTGDEPFLIDRFLEALRRVVLGPGGDNGFNLELLDAKEKGLGAVVDGARTVPMFATRRLLVVRGIQDLKSEQLEPLLPYIKDPNPSTCLVLVASGKVDARWKVFQGLKKAGHLHEFARLRDWQLGDWLAGEARRKGLSVARDALAALAESAGPDLGRLSLCLEQVALYAGEGTPITGAHVEAVVPESRERGIFELTKAIGAGRTPQAMHLLGALVRNREPALRIQFMLLRQLRQIWRAKELLAQAVPRQEMAAQVGINPYFLDDVLVPARKMSTAALEKSFELLYEADRKLKSSRIDPDIQVARLVRQLCDKAAGRA